MYLFVVSASKLPRAAVFGLRRHHHWDPCRPELQHPTCVTAVGIGVAPSHYAQTPPPPPSPGPHSVAHQSDTTRTPRCPEPSCPTSVATSGPHDVADRAFTSMTPRRPELSPPPGPHVAPVLRPPVLAPHVLSTRRAGPSQPRDPPHATAHRAATAGTPRWPEPPRPESRLEGG